MMTTINLALGRAKRRVAYYDFKIDEAEMNVEKAENALIAANQVLEQYRIRRGEWREAVIIADDE